MTRINTNLQNGIFLTTEHTENTETLGGIFFDDGDINDEMEKGGVNVLTFLLYLNRLRGVLYLFGSTFPVGE